MKIGTRILPLLGIILLQNYLVKDAWAWGDVGHSAVGYIAEKNLTPEGKNLVFQILGLEPLANSGVWPDQVRSDGRFKAFSPYHYVEIPDGKTFDQVPAKERAAKSAHTIASKVPAMLVSSKYSRNQKAILLKYLVHVIGDIHMPLHVGNGVDRGANLCLVNWKDPHGKQMKVSNLHTVWDEGLIEVVEAEYGKSKKSYPGQKRFFGYRQLVDVMDKEAASKRRKRMKTLSYKAANSSELKDWYVEAKSLHRQAYPDGKKPIKAEERPYCKMVDPVSKKVVKGVFDENKIPTLEEKYINKTLPLMKKQIRLAGFRLAGIINEAAKKAKISPIGKNVESDLIKSVLIEK